MEQKQFKDWTLDTLDDTFGLRQIWDCELLEKWQTLAQNQEVSALEKDSILNLQEGLIKGSSSWNEAELESRFITPFILLSNIEEADIKYFLERRIQHVLGDYKLIGKVDGIIAKGFRNPKTPFFCMHEYKKSVENAGMPDAQALVAMLVARELNENKKPIYGLYIVGVSWHFMVLNKNEYCISRTYNAESDELFDIFKMLKALKVIIKTELLD